METEDADKDETTYFTSYEELSIHELMLKDEPRTRAYQLYIENNPDLFKGKVVIDVGAGTGILSLFAAKAGAKKVYAVEASNLATLCKEIVTANCYEQVIEVFHSKIEDAELPLGKSEADVIVSEWMGVYLLHEAMLPSVIFARNKWLKPDGLMVPNTATIYMCPVNMNDYINRHIRCWDRSYGFNFQPLKKRIQEKHQQRPLIETVQPSKCLANPQMVAHFHLKYVANEDLIKINRSLNYEITKNGICHGFACWFDCSFNGEDMDDDEAGLNCKKILLSTGPDAPVTHWKQTVIMLPDGYMVSKSENFQCSLELLQDQVSRRTYNISLQIDDDSDDNEEEGEQGPVELENLVETVDDDEVKKMILEVLK